MGKVKLTKAQRAVLERVCDTGSMSRNEAAYEGGSGRTLGALEKRDLLVSVNYANGRFWLPTDAGRAALKES